LRLTFIEKTDATVSTIRYQCRKMPVSVKAKHKSIHASIHRRFTGGFFLPS
ncbi:TPA: diguanylate cyclase, partial [Escherichia coli]|nr:diguanylate cyclase [Escherichia coli]